MSKQWPKVKLGEVLRRSEETKPREGVTKQTDVLIVGDLWTAITLLPPCGSPTSSPEKVL